MKYKIAVIVGSLRKGSINRKAAENMMRLAPEQLEMSIIEIGQLPHYDEDLDADNPPEEWTEFRRQVKANDGVFFFTPEYNRSIPGVLKNAIDVGSRPYGQSAWEGKPVAVASATMSGLGAYLANHTLRQSLVFLDMPVMQQPEIYLADGMNLFDDDGRVVETSEKFFAEVMEAYAAWVAKILKS